MCGIAGAVWRNGEDREVLRAMTRRLAHRGPDDEQFHWGGTVALGVRRLAIMDPERGRQPVYSDRGSVAVCNGEIYNHESHRRALESGGVRFRSGSDTEVIPSLFDRAGTSFVSQLRGEYALAAIDCTERTLLLARDPLGVKPLFYLSTPDGFWFASEMKSLVAAPGFAPQVDRAALDLLLAFKHIPGDATLLAGVRSLRPGERLVYDLASHSFTIEPFYTVPTGEHDASDAEAADEVRRRLDEAVRLRLMSDVPLGVALSGGLDSSAVVASVARQAAAPPRTFSVFTGDRVNELGFARLVAERYKTDHHETSIQPDDLEALLPRIMWHMEEPLSISEVPTWVLGQAVSPHVRVLLCGEGADELFGGYKRLVPIGSAPRLPESVLKWGYLRGINGLTAGDRRRLYGPDQRPFLSGNSNPWLDRALSTGQQGVLNRFLGYELGQQLRSQVFRLDKLTMAHGVEARCPFLDPGLVDYVSGLPGGMKIRRLREKVLLRDAVADRLPAEVVARRKFGMANPVGALFRGGFRDLCRAAFTARADVLAEYFSLPALDSMFSDIGRYPTWWRIPEQQLFHVYLFLLWHELFVEGGGSRYSSGGAGPAEAIAPAPATGESAAIAPAPATGESAAAA
jgi:asparagine synthase (glutamine-hydrolysing)